MPVPTDAPNWLTSGRIPSLDGLRAVAVITVTLAHVLSAPGSPFPASWHIASRLGAVGVNVFFVISGFLITHLLLNELRKHGRVSLGGFYLRRSLRIIPAYLFLIAFGFVLTRADFLYIRDDAWIPLITYTFNLSPIWLAAAPAFGHCWSLCVEEHFYLLWPIALVILGRRLAPIFLFAAVVVAPAVRFLLVRIPNSPDADYFTPTRLDTFAIGCLLAYVAHGPRAWIAVRLVRGRGSLVAISAIFMVLVSVYYLSRSGVYVHGPKAMIDGMAICALLVAVTADPRCRVARVLNSRPLVAIGVLSYSLYLAQPFAFPQSHTPGWPLSWWWNVPLVVAYALVSYFLVEKPFLRLKDRLSRVKTTPRADVVSRS